MEFIGDFRGDILEVNRCARDALEADAVEWQARQFANFHFPLHVTGIRGGAMATEQHKLLPVLVITIVYLENFLDLLDHVLWLHWAGRLHAPREAERSRLVRRITDLPEEKKPAELADQGTTISRRAN